MKREVKAPARGGRLLSFIVTGTGTAAISGGMTRQAVLTDHGAGDYTLTYTQPFTVAPVVSITCATETLMPEIVSSSVTALRFNLVDNDGTPTATDGIAHVLVFGSDSTDGMNY